jgi:serine/threonine protein kinase
MTSEIASGTLLQGRYRVEKQIGQGGMGAIYKATDERLHNQVALKQFLVSGYVDEKSLERLTKAFEREAELLSKMRHSALPRVIDYFADETGKYLVMDFITGQDLGELLRANNNAPLEVAKVLGWADQLLDALNYLHSHEPPILHRDIKPDNIKLTPKGQIMLLDFGLASSSALLQSEMGEKTHTIAMGFTQEFAPMEQVHGLPSTVQSDIYSLASTLYMLLAGKPPASAAERSSTIMDGRDDPLVSPHMLNPQVSQAVSEVLVQALALKTGNRHESAAELRSVLQDVASSGGEGDYTPTQISPGIPGNYTRTQLAPPPTTTVPQKKSFPLIPIIGGGSAVIVLLVAAVVFFVVMKPSTNTPGTPTTVAEVTTFSIEGNAPPPSAVTATLAEQQNWVAHDDWVNDIAFAPNGIVLATAGGDGTAQIWNVQDGSVLYTLEGHEGAVNSVAFTSNSATLATAGEDGIVQLWNVQDGTMFLPLEGHEDAVNCVVFSPDGATLATASSDGTVRLWNVDDGTAREKLEGHEFDVWGVAFSPDGATLASAGADATVRLWDVGNGMLRHTLSHNDEVTSVAFSGNGAMLASSSKDYTVRLWDVTSGTEQRQLKSDEYIVASVDFSRDSLFVVSGSQRGDVRLWRANDGELLYETAHERAVQGLAFNADTTMLASGSKDGVVKLWNISRHSP